MKQACLLIALLVIFIAPAAFGCAQCKADLQQCPVCLETDYDGGQYCVINDLVGCVEKRVCFGPGGYEFCGGPCIPYPNLVEIRSSERLGNRFREIRATREAAQPPHVTFE